MSAVKEAYAQLQKRFEREVRSSDHREANGRFVWDILWSQNNIPRFKGMMPVYRRILELAGEGAGRRVVDFGGGPGALAAGLARKGWKPTVVDISAVAAMSCRRAGLGFVQFDLEDASRVDLDAILSGAELVVGTEFLEHLSAGARGLLLEACEGRKSLWSVPNDCLGPEEEPQHTIQWSPGAFRKYLRYFYAGVEVEPMKRYMLAHCSD